MPTETIPRHPFDFLLWPIIRLVWEHGFGSRKNAHFWHWQPIAESEVPQERFTPKLDMDAAPIRGPFSKFWNLNFGWQTVALLTTEEKTAAYQLGFTNVSGTEGVAGLKKIAGSLRCSIVIPAGTTFAVPIGPHSVEYFAVSLAGDTFHLKEVGRTSKRCIPKDMLLL